MGSIELFPRTQPRRAAIDAWRSTPVAGSGAVRVREARFGDYAAIRALQKRAAGATPPCSVRQFESRLHGFGAGQVVATCDGQVVGYASALLIDWDAPHSGERTWATLTGDGAFTTHEPQGRSLYAAELVVDASARGFGAGRSLLQAQRKLARRLNMKRVVATPMLAGYDGLDAGVTPEDFAMRIVWGDAVVPEWRFLMAQGFQYCGVVRSFHWEGSHAGLLAWLNPLYGPPRPPADEESVSRKCA